MSFVGSLFADKVVVIGAGLAGLTAAYRLQQSGMDVSLYEARARVGGRVFSVNVKGHIAELGGHNITDGGEALHLFRLIKELGLKVTETQVLFNPTYFNGHDFTPVSKLFLQGLENQLLNLSGSSNMKDILDSILDASDPLYQVLSVRLAAYEGAPIEKLSSFYVTTLFQIIVGDQREENYVNCVTIQGGNGQLPVSLARKLGDRLHLSKVLTTVSKNEGGTFALTFHDGDVVHADLLVLAIPCSVYEEISFENNVIAPERLKAIQSIQYGTTAKIVIPVSNMDSKRNGFINDKMVSFFDAEPNTFVAYLTGEASIFSDETILARYA